MEERMFRHRALWTNQTYQYQCTLISIFWFGIKILFDITRKNRQVRQDLKELIGKEKGATAKKND